MNHLGVAEVGCEYRLKVDQQIRDEISVNAEDAYGYSIGEGFGSLEGDAFNLHFIHVLSRLGRGGIGTAIFQALTSVAKERGAQRLVGHFSPDEGREEPARAFYTKMGVKIDSVGMLHKNL